MRFYIFLFILTFTSNLFAQKDWQLKKNTEGIKVYYRSAVDSDVKELKIVTEIEASPDAIMKILGDASKHPDWIYSCASTKVLEKKSEDEIYFYDVLDFPWPMNDRDIIGHLVVTKDAAGTITTVNNAAPNYIPKKKDIVRIKESKATWILTPQMDGSTNMTYFLRSHPGGALPAWVVNLVIDRGPVQSVKKLKTLVKRG